MKRKAGFTLVELLVVMAIISILAAIAIPNVIKYIRKGNATKALADIKGIETALTDVLADAGRSSLEQLFNPAGVTNWALNIKRLQHWPPQTTDEFAAATQLYTRALVGLLRSGRNVLGSDLDTKLGFSYTAILQPDIVRKLGTNYIDIGLDPWGNLYNIYPGPWTARDDGVDANGLPIQVRAPVPFRIYTKTKDQQDMPGASRQQSDSLVITGYTDPENADVYDVGFPAQGNQIAFIWSSGQNLLNSQVLYNGLGYPADPTQAYDQGQGLEFAGGGDDINNWDNGNSWGRFY